MRRALVLALFAALTAVPSAARAEGPDPVDWASVEAAARGQDVYFHAWGGAAEINSYIEWAARELAARHGVTLHHVRLSDTAEAVSRVLAEKAAGREAGGSVDLIWINGENFAAMKQAGLLRDAGWAERLPNARLLDSAANPGLVNDFGVPVEGLESPWGLAQLTFYYDSARLSSPPTSLAGLADWIAAHPGRFTYAAPPSFIGTSFLKQLLYGLTPDPSVLRRDVVDADFAAATAPLWAWLERIAPDLWRSGRIYATGTPHLKTLLADGEIDIAMTFNPAEASAAIRSHMLPETVRSFVLDYGSVGNTHFLAIPFNASAPAGAMVAANFLLSPEAQARKADEMVWGDPTVLAMSRLNAGQRALFEALERGPATLAPDELGPSLAEPHQSWTARLEAEWLARFGAGS